MSIAKVAASSNISTTTHSNSAVNALEKQKMQLSKQIEAVKNSKEDSKIKEEKIKELTEQMTELDKEILQAKIEEKDQELQAAQEKNAEKAATSTDAGQDDEYKDGVIVSASLNKLVAANYNFSEYKQLHSLNEKIKGENRVAQSEMKQSNSRAGGSVKYQMNLIANNDAQINGIEYSMGKKVKALQKDIKQAIKLNVISAQKSRNSDETAKIGEEKSNNDNSPIADADEDSTETVTANNDGDKVVPKEEKDKEIKSEHKSINLVV